MNVFVREVNGITVEHTINGIDQLAQPARLGDKIDKITKPIARAIDRVAGTKIVGCGGCRKMKDRLNAGMPITEALKLRIRGK